MNPALIQLAMAIAPEIIALFKERFGHAHPDQPTPTDAQVIAAYNNAFVSSLAKDEAWLQLHGS